MDLTKAKARILSLAFQGKLSDMQQEDNNLLNSIHHDHIDYVPVAKSEELIIAPNHWRWTRLGYITQNHGQTVPDETFCYIDVGTLDNIHHCLASKENIVEPKNAPSRARKKVEFGDVLYSTVRPYLHNICMVDRSFSHTPIASTAFCVMEANESVVLNKYLFYWLLTPEFDRYSNGDPSKGMLYPAISEKELLRGPIPLPPLPEQHHIVAKIDAIFSLLDTIDALQSAYTANQKALRAKLIDAAIRGQLTEQLPEDGTAEELYQQIQQEKLALEKAGKIKKSKPLPPISDEEKPFDIPANWKWVRLSNIIYDKPTNGFSPKGVDYPTKIKNLTLTATTSGVLKPEAYKYVDIPLEAANKYWLVKDDILIQRSNSVELVGTSCVFTGNDHEYIYPDLMMRIHVLPMVDTDYVARILKAPFTRQYYMSRASGSSGSMPKINQETVANTLVPLPPLAEQKRIAAKLEELLPLCD